jgi:hypothetical protein
MTSPPPWSASLLPAAIWKKSGRHGPGVRPEVGVTCPWSEGASGECLKCFQVHRAKSGAMGRVDRRATQ